MRFFTTAIFIGLVLSGCSKSQSNDDIQLKCEEQGKVFKMKDKLNLRTGEYEKVGYCY